MGNNLLSGQWTGRGFRLLGLLAVLALVFSADLTAASLPDDPVQVAKLVAADGAGYSTMGECVAIDGDTAIVGALETEVGGNINQGAAYIYYRNRDGLDAWGQVAKLIAPDGAANDRFGAVAIDGDTAVVGAPFAGGNYRGKAYVYYRNEGGPDAWGLVKELPPVASAPRDAYGSAVAVDGDTILVGAPHWSGLGKVHVYDRNQGGPDAWGQVAEFSASGVELGWFGSGVSLQGDTAAITAPYADVGGNADQGAAYIFYRNWGGPDAWGQVASLTASDAGFWDHFGIRVSLRGDTALVGAFFNRVDDNQQGAAYVFNRDQDGEDEWGQVAKLTAPSTTTYKCFGTVAVNGDTAVVGVYYDGGFCNVESSTAYVYHRDQGGPDAWGRAAELTADDNAAADGFGSSVATDGNTAVVGAMGANVGGNVDQGAAYVFYGVQSNRPPVAAAGGPYTVTEGGSVTLDGTGSSDPDPGDTLTYAWDLDNDGVFETAGATADFAGIDGFASHPVTLQVCDSQAACTTDATTVEVTNVGPTAAAGADVTVYRNETATLTGAWSDPAAALDAPYAWTWDLDGDGVADASGSAAYGETASATATFTTEGVYDLTFTVTDADGAGGQDSVRVTVLNRPPDCTAAAASPALLWPPNNKFVRVALGGVTDAEGDPLTLVVTAIRQDEPIGKGNSAPDGKGVGAAAIELRAEKLGSGNGRVYHVSFTASDGHGGACTGVVRVAVPHDQAKPAVDGGPLYDSTVPTP